MAVALEAQVRRVVEDFGAQSVVPDAIYGVDADIFAPCALGAVVNDATLDQFTFDIIAGAANNVLANSAVHGAALQDRGILYAPDYVINAGGIVNVSVEFHDGGYDEKVALRKIERIPQALKELWTISKEEDVPPCFAADRLAQRILAAGKAGGR